jgi:hypothetical protein
MGKATTHRAVHHPTDYLGRYFLPVQACLFQGQVTLTWNLGSR